MMRPRLANPVCLAAACALPWLVACDVATVSHGPAGGHSGGADAAGGQGGGGGSADAAPQPGPDGAATERPPADAMATPDAASGGTCSKPDLATMCPGIKSIPDFFTWVNKQRDSYGGVPPYGYHERWKGIPWKGMYHTMNTFPIDFTWDDALACRAQTEAERVAAGGTPAGEMVEGQNGCCGYMWIDGLNTADWRLTAHQKVDAKGKDLEFGFGLANGSARMALHYHDFGGDGPVIKHLGVGGAVGKDCLVHWVLQFGP